MINLVEIIMYIFGTFIFFYMLIVISVYGCMLLLAFLQLKKQYRLDRTELDNLYIDSFYSKPVSIIVPAYNEEVGIVDTVYSLLSLRYPEIEIIIVNDGSTDSTQRVVIDQFEMKPIEKVVRKDIETKKINQIYQSHIHPHCILVEKENGGKADALNAGINVSRYPYFCSMDGDSMLDELSLLRVMEPIILSNGEVIATGGSVRIANGMNMQLGSIIEKNLSNHYIVLMQIIEYLRAFLMGRIALSQFNLVLIISGAFSVFSKRWVVEAGGYSEGTIGEDMELVVRLHRLVQEKGEKKRIEFVPNPICWTEAPQSLAILRRQRRRWHQGLMESLWSHRKMTLNPKYGSIGLVSFPYFWLVECLGPIIELGGYIYLILSFFLGQIHYEIAILLLLSFVIYGVIFSIVSVLFDAWSMSTYPKISDTLRMVVLSFTEIFWYRPLTLIWRFEGLCNFLRDKKEWGQMEREGISKKENSI